MAIENFQSEDGKELREIIQRYESAREMNKNIFLDADQFADIAEEYVEQDRFDEALGAATSGLNIHPGNITLLTSLATIYLDMDNTEKAREVIEFLIGEESIDYTEIKLLEAELLIAEGRMRESEAILDTMVTDDPTTLSDIVFLYKKTDSAEKIINLLNKAARKNPDDERIMAEVGECFMHISQYDRSVEIFERLANDYPYNIKYWIRLAECYIELRDYSKALDSCDFALAIDEKYGEVHAYKANILFEIGNHEESIAEYRLAYKYGAISEGERLQLTGANYCDDENWNTALNYFRRAHEMTDESSLDYDYLLYYMARCYFETGDYDNAIRFCKLHIDRAAIDLTLTYLLLGEIYLELDDNVNVLKSYTMALNISTTANTWYLIGKSLLENECYRPAEIALLKVKELEPDHPLIGRDLALVYIGLCDFENLKPYKKYLLQYLEEYIEEYLTDENRDKIEWIRNNLIKDININEEEEEEENNLTSNNN